MLSGIVFIVLLGLVFVPQLFRDQPPVATPVAAVTAVEKRAQELSCAGRP